MEALSSLPESEAWEWKGLVQAVQLGMGMGLGLEPDLLVPACALTEQPQVFPLTQPQEEGKGKGSASGGAGGQFEYRLGVFLQPVMPLGHSGW